MSGDKIIEVRRQLYLKRKNNRNFIQNLYPLSNYDDEITYWSHNHMTGLLDDISMSGNELKNVYFYGFL